MERFQNAVAFFLVVILTFLFVLAETSKFSKHSPNFRRRLW
jgi:hypothetical protein